MSMIILLEHLSHNNYYTFIGLELSSDRCLFCSRSNRFFKFSFIAYSPNSTYYNNSIFSQWLVHCLWVLGASLSATLLALRLK